MLLQYQKSQTDSFFRFWDIQLYMTEPPDSGELETVNCIGWIDCYLFNVRSKNYRLHEVKANVGHRSSNLEQKVGYLFHPVYTIDF